MTPLILGTLLLVTLKHATIVPAPCTNFPYPTAIHTSQGRVPLDAQGTGITTGMPRSSAFRSFLQHLNSKEYWYYFPRDFGLVSLRLRPPLGDRALITETRFLILDAEETWGTARGCSIRTERADGDWAFRLALPRGEHRLGILAPGYTPLITSVSINGPDETLPLMLLSPAAEVRARIRDGKSGALIRSWTAEIIGQGPGEPSEIAKMLQSLPLVGSGPLEFRSLPPGLDWSIAIHVPGAPTIRRGLPSTAAGTLHNLGDVYTATAGALRLRLLFPKDVPAEPLSVTLTPTANDNADTSRRPIATRTVAARADTLIEFNDLDPAELHLTIAAPAAGLYRAVEVPILGGRLAEVELALMPIDVTGQVLRAKAAVVDAHIALTLSGEQRSRCASDENGSYRCRVWTSGTYLLTSSPPGGTQPFPETVEISDGADRITHDVLLPANALRGQIVDDETGAPISNAQVNCASAKFDSGGPMQFNFGATTSDDGHYEANNLRSVPLDVTVRAKGYSTQRFERIVPVEEGTELNVRLRRGVTLKVRLLDERGAPLVGARLGLDTTTSGNAFQQRALSTTDGIATIDDLTEGPHLLYAHACGRQLAIQRVAARTETTEPITITLADARHALTIQYVRDPTNPQLPSGVTFGVGALPLPRFALSYFARPCGQASTADTGGRLSLDFLPEAPLTAYSDTGQLLGSFLNDGSASTWIIPLTHRSQ